MSIGIATSGMFNYIRTIETFVPDGGGGGDSIYRTQRPTPTVRVSRIKYHKKKEIKISLVDIREV